MLRITVVALCVCFLFCCVVALPHCEVTQIPKRLVVSDVINVIYTMESSCRICVQQASRLPRLKRYLERKGIKTHFVIGVSGKADRLSGTVPHIQVNSRHVWRSLGEQNNHFYIVDRCGRLVYEVINPWSNLNLMFVKAAVATTAHSHPCGLCPVDYLRIPKEEELQEFPSLSSYSQALPDDSSALLHVRLRHKHRGDPNIYNYIVKVAGLPYFHGHLPHDRQRVPTVGTTTTEKSEVVVTEKSSVFISSRRRFDTTESLEGTDQSEESSTLKSNIEHPGESSTLKSILRPGESSTSKSVVHPGESSTLESIVHPGESSTLKSVVYPGESSNLKHSIVSPKESLTADTKGQSTEPLRSSISNSLSGEVQHRGKDLEEPINTNRSETSQVNNKLQTTTENTQNENTEIKGTTQSEDINSFDYDDDYEKRDKELTSEEEAELINLRAHYRRIIDWVDFFSHENYD